MSEEPKMSKQILEVVWQDENSSIKFDEMWIFDDDKAHQIQDRIMQIVNDVQYGGKLVRNPTSP